MPPDNVSVAVLGGAVSGLAAAEGLTSVDAVDEVRVFERQTYEEKRVNCGEAINDSTLVPLEKTPENGFRNDVAGFQLRIYSGTDRQDGESPLGVSDLRCSPGYICDRDTVERRWAVRLEGNGVEFRTGSSVTHRQYESVVEDFDYVVDATGVPSLTHKVRDDVSAYAGEMVALNAPVEGDFSEYERWPRIFFEGYVGYAWSFPKSATRANVGIGWASEERPDDYVAALVDAAERNGYPTPDRRDVNVYTIPKGPSLRPSQVHFPEDGVFLVGDAAGIANRYQGEGICQGIRSAYLLTDLIERGTEETYPTRLYDSMKAEYRLAHLMRGVWTEFEDPKLLARVAESLDGLTIDDVTRHPAAVVGRVLRRPAVAARLVGNGGMLRRAVEAYTDSWEYERSADAQPATGSVPT